MIPPAEIPLPLDLEQQFGAIDIYLFDQLLRGRIRPGMRILDAGMGAGRNLHYFLRAGYDVHGVDTDEHDVETVQMLARRLAPSIPPGRFRREEITALSAADASFDVVLCNAVLHFMPDEATFRHAVHECWRVLRPGGLFFARLATSIGLDGTLQPLGGRWYQLPDGSRRFLADEALLRATTAALGARFLDPLKTTLVADQRSMTTWVLGKP